MNFARRKRTLKPCSIPTKYLLPSHSYIPKFPSARSKRRETKEKREMVIEDEFSVDKDPEDNVQPVNIYGVTTISLKTFLFITLILICE